MPSSCDSNVLFSVVFLIFLPILMATFGLGYSYGKTAKTARR